MTTTFKVCITLLLYMYVHQRNNRVFIASTLIRTNSKFDIITRRLWKCLAKPRRVVELAAGVSRTTPLPIPYSIVSVICSYIDTRSSISGVTEVIVIYKRRYSVSLPVEISVGTTTSKLSSIAYSRFISG